MKNIDYIIVGGGYAGFFFAHQIISNNKTFILFNDHQAGASKVSAGVINPVVLKKFTTFWLAQQQVDYLLQVLSEIEKYTGKNYLISENIHRIFHDENEKKLWLKKSETEELQAFLDPEFDSLDTIKNPFGTGKVTDSYRLNVHGFFNDFTDFLQKNNSFSDETFDYSKISGNSYGDFTFKHIVFCEGIGVKNNPFFSEIPIVANKGHHLKVKLSERLNQQFTLKKKHFLFPLNDDLHYYGGTYDPNPRENLVDDFKVEELMQGLQEFYPCDFTVEDVKYGFRPTVKDRRPILGNLPNFPDYYVFNGLGARGILNGCYFSKELFEHIENGKDLIPEVALSRFNL